MEEMKVKGAMEGIEEKINAMPEIEKARRSIDIILQSGVDFNVTIENPGILRRMGILKKYRSFVIYPLNLGTMDRISTMIMEANLSGLDKVTDEEEMEKANYGHVVMSTVLNNIKGNKGVLAGIIAAAIVNRNPDVRNHWIAYWRKRKEEGIRQFLIWNLTAGEMRKLTQLVIRQMDITPFLSSLVSIRGISVIPEEQEQSGNGKSLPEQSRT
jgi:hypothetical protein